MSTQISGSVSASRLRRRARDAGAWGGALIGPAAVAVCALVVSGLALAAPPRAVAAEGFAFDRLAGADRYATADAIAKAAFPDGATDALLARGDDFADALAGNYLAGSLSAPVLLSGRSDVPDATVDTLEALGVQAVTLLGGTAALGDAVRTELESAGFSVERVAGTDRYETAAAIAEEVGTTGVGTVDGERAALVATGEKFPDALAGGPVSYAGGFPIVLTPTAGLGAAASTTLESLDIDRVYVLGGTAAVSEQAATDIEDLGITVQRLAGANRSATAAAIARFALTNLDFVDTHVNLATGADFADAMTGGAHAGGQPAPILLATEDTTGPACGFLTDQAATLTDGTVYGGTTAVPDATRTSLEDCAGGGQPRMVTGVADTGGDTITITYDQPVTCVADSADQFAYGGATSASPTSAECPSGDTLVLTFSDITGDGDLTYTEDPADPTIRVTSPEGEEAVTPQTISVTDPPPEILLAEAAPADDTVTLTYSEAVSCVETSNLQFQYLSPEATETFKPRTISGCITSPGTTVLLEFDSGQITGPGTLTYTESSDTTARITDAGGQHAVSPQSVDDTPPTMVEAFATPAPASTDPSAGTTTVKVTYDQAIQCADVDPAQFSLEGLAAATDASCSASVLTLDFDGTATDGTLTYTPGAAPDAHVKDAAGTSDPTSPQEVESDSRPFMIFGLVDAATNSLAVTFSESVTCTAGSTDRFTFTGATTAVPETVSCSGSTVVLTFDALEDGGGNLEYDDRDDTIHIVKDASGNQAVQQTLDVVLPQIDSATANPDADTVTLTYNEDVECASSGAGQFLFTGASGDPTVVACDGSETVVLTFAAGDVIRDWGDVSYSEGSAADRVKDLTGNEAVSPQALTATDPAPRMTSATSGTDKKKITVTYSEPVRCDSTNAAAAIAAQFEYSLAGDPLNPNATGVVCNDTTTVVLSFDDDIIDTGGTLTYEQATAADHHIEDLGGRDAVDGDSRTVSAG